MAAASMRLAAPGLAANSRHVDAGGRARDEQLGGDVTVAAAGGG
jgi:hypothetical protein